MNEGNAFFIIVLLLICFMGYLNTGSETNLKRYEELSEYDTKTKVFEESGLDQQITASSIIDLTLAIENRIELVNSSHHPELLESAGNNRGSPKRA